MGKCLNGTQWMLILFYISLLLVTVLATLMIVNKSSVGIPWYSFSSNHSHSCIIVYKKNLIFFFQIMFLTFSNDEKTPQAQTQNFQNTNGNKKNLK